jgi:hypothetical protein
VVSGDLTNGNQEDGYEELESLLDELGSSRPDDSQVLIVPGNHDTDWAIQPGNPAKFRRFLDAVRPSYHSPLISGLDYDANTLARATGSRPKAHPVLELADVAIVGLSSADYCGVQEQKTTTPWAEVIRSYGAGATDAAARSKRAQAEKDLRSLRVQDMARIDSRQLDALEARFAGTSLELPADADVRLRIAVLHHPICPVTDQEEIKAFDALTNLALVRSFLFDHGFHVVLHGHKHASFLGWDWLLPPGDNLDAIPRRALVVAAPGDFRPDKLVCRLLEAAPDSDKPVAGAPRLRVISLVGPRVGQPLKGDFNVRCISLAQPFIRSADTGTPWVVRARTADAAYQQLRDLPTDLAEPRAVISVVDDPSSVNDLPLNYPGDFDSGWLRNLVEWWQLSEPEAVRAFAGSDFNHGERLYGYDDAVAKAAMALPSSKAIALLVDADEAGAANREFPAFTAVQLQARKNGSAGTLIDAVGIYRKQDLALWWPVNIAELARIQDRAVDAAAENSKLNQPVRKGRLIAVATIGFHDTVLPEMAGTVLDRAVDLRREWPHRLAYLAAQPRRETQREWADALSDVGLVEDDMVLVPSIGLKRLLEALEMHRGLGEGVEGFGKVVTAVEKLAEDAAQAIDALPGARGATRDYWARRLQEDAAGVLRAVKRAVTAEGIDWA